MQLLHAAESDTEAGCDTEAGRDTEAAEAVYKSVVTFMTDTYTSTTETSRDSNKETQLLVHYVSEVLDNLETLPLHQVCNLMCNNACFSWHFQVRAIASTASHFQDRKVLALRLENLPFEATLSFDKKKIQALVRALKCGHSNIKRRLTNPNDPTKCEQKAIVIFLESLPKNIVHRAESI